MSDKVELSVAVMASNEEANIGRCLSSVKGLAREVILLLNDSTDRTEEIARGMGATIYHESAWHGFCEQRKRSIEKCTQVWVLCLDADEEVSPALAEEIRSYIRASGYGTQGASCPRKVWFLGRWITHGDWYPGTILRLTQKDKCSVEGGIDHDHLVVNGSVHEFNSDLLHYSFRNMDHQLAKIPPFADAYLERMLERDEKWNAPAVIFRSIWRFIRAYILRLGFLDGYPGFYIAWFQAFSTCYRHTKLYQHQVADRRPDKLA